MTTQDRKELLLRQTAVTGVDFVFVHPGQQTLDVRFLVDPSALDTPLSGNLDAERLTVAPVEAGDPTVSISNISWHGPAGAEDVLRITFEAPGGFSPYRLAINDDRLDPFYSSVQFSFKANCPVDIDCQPPCRHCPPDDPVDFPVDYLARDFESYRRALLDFASQRYPGWEERSEADTGAMVIELMAALGDELAYYQDRVSREAYLETAMQRRSLRAHAALVDYDVHDGRGANGWICVEVAASQQGMIPAGTAVWAADEDDGHVHFSVGTSIRDTADYDVRSELNSIPAHVWDQGTTCLHAGSTELDLRGALQSAFVFNDPPADPSGRWVFLTTSPSDRSVPARAQLVRVTHVTELTDTLLGASVTRIRWEKRHALTHDMELESLRACGNAVPITAGRNLTSFFRIGYPDSPGDTTPVAVERQGRTISSDLGHCGCDEDHCQHAETRSTRYLFSLPETDTEGLVWLDDQDGQERPEIILRHVDAPNTSAAVVREWDYRRSFLRSSSSGPEDTHFTIEDGQWKRVIGFQRVGVEIEHVDYASGEGQTMTFGDGEFGRLPDTGAIFSVTYRVGNGEAGNVPAQGVSHIEPGLTFVEGISNPLPTFGGQEHETSEAVRRDAPQAFRVDTRRAVRPEDYAEAAERLPWVQRAGARFRWTGSWLTAFVTPDPEDAFEVSPAQVAGLQNQLDRFRQAGRPAHVKRPKYADLDLEITVCAKTSSFRQEVREAVESSLSATGAARPSTGFFSPDNFTFGTPLERAALEAHIQSVSGVLAVRSIRVRRRGHFDWRDFTELTYEVADDEVVRIENDPDHPDHGIATVTMEGGA
ncbi:MAG: hypothetical protein WD208_13585 [Dehalococcoidia bacterium]